jgi:hypothetical protein
LFGLVLGERVFLCELKYAGFVLGGAEGVFRSDDEAVDCCAVEAWEVCFCHDVFSQDAIEGFCCMNSGSGRGLEIEVAQESMLSIFNGS